MDTFSSSEQCATLTLELFNFFTEFLFRRLKIRGHAFQTLHSFNLSVYNFPVKSDLILREILFAAEGTINHFSAGHCFASRSMYAATFFPPYSSGSIACNCCRITVRICTAGRKQYRLNSPLSIPSGEVTCGKSNLR